MKNEFIEFYGKHGISPVHQDISDLDKHLKRRSNLYKMLGIDERLFKDADVLEVGPGGGFNSICFAKWGAKLDLLEPNPHAHKEIEQNLQGYKYNLYKGIIEEYKTDKKYDFIIAEGFFHSMQNPDEIFAACMKILKNDGILVLTCIDEISHFYEDLRRIISFKLIKNLQDFKKQVDKLCIAFAKHLNTLRFSSRPINDWVSDVILNSSQDLAYVNIKKTLQIAVAYERERERVELLGVNPCLVGNLSWYKDTSYSYAKAFMQGYDAKKHLLLDCTWSDFYRDERLNNALNADLIVFRELIKAYKYGERSIDEIINILKQIRDKNADLPNSFALCIDEVLNLLARDFSADHVANSKQFSKSWGRGMQYIAFTAK